MLTFLGGTARLQAASGSTPAPTVAASPDAQKRAKAHFAKGKALQDKDDFEHAIVEYKAAYDLMPLPDLIFNIAQCERLKGDQRAALDDFQRYLVIAPAGRGAGEARSFVAALGPEVSDAERRHKEQKEKDEQARRDREAQLSKEEATQRDQEAQLAARTRLVERMRVQDAQAGAKQDAEAQRPTDAIVIAKPAPAPEPAGDDRGSTLRMTGLITAGFGAALMAGGIVFRSKAISARNELDQLAMGTPTAPMIWNQDRYDSFQTDKTLTYVLTSLGGAALVGGGVMYFLGRSAEAGRTAVAVAPARLPGGAGLTFAVSLR